jgi:hypothetical protein
LLVAAEAQKAAVIENLQWSEYPELDVSAPPVTFKLTPQALGV